MFLQTRFFLLGTLLGAAPALASKNPPAQAPAVVVASKPAAQTGKAAVQTAAIPASTATAKKSELVLTLESPAAPTPPAPAPLAEKAASFPASPVQQTTIVQTEGAKFAPSVQALPVQNTIWRKAHQKGYFVFHFANKFFAHEDFEFDGRSLSLGFGAQFWRNAELELYINTGRTTPSFGLKYSYPFAGEGETWIPGADASLLLGLIDERDREFRELLAAGAGAGLFLKTFVSKKYALIARGGASFSVPVSGSLWDELPKIYISLGFKRYFN